MGSITTCSSQAALAGLASFVNNYWSNHLLIAQEIQLAELGQALEVLYALWRLDEISGMQGAQNYGPPPMRGYRSHAVAM